MTTNFLLSALSVFLFGRVSDFIGMDNALYLFTFCAFLTIPFVLLLPERDKNISF